MFTWKLNGWIKKFFKAFLIRVLCRWWFLNLILLWFFKSKHVSHFASDDFSFTCHVSFNMSTYTREDYSHTCVFYLWNKFNDTNKHWGNYKLKKKISSFYLFHFYFSFSRFFLCPVFFSCVWYYTQSFTRLIYNKKNEDEEIF